MKNRIRMLFLFPVLIAALCSCVTPYKRASNPAGDGYYDTKLQDGVYEVSFYATSDTPMIKVRDFAVLRAAECCLQNGYKTFVPLNRGDLTTVREDLEMDSREELVMKVYEERPGAVIIVKCSTEDNLFYKAGQISESLRAKYRLPKSNGNVFKDEKDKRDFIVGETDPDKPVIGEYNKEDWFK